MENKLHKPYYYGFADLDAAQEAKRWSLKPLPHLLCFLAIVAIMGIVFLWATKARASYDLSTIARAQIGCGEVGGDNRGKYVRRYLDGQERLPWCAGFVSYCVREAGYKTKYTLRARSYLNIGKRVRNPLPEDIVVFSRGRKPCGHVGIIEKVSEDGFVSIEGNTGSYPSKVRRINHKFNEKNIIGFVRLGVGYLQ